MAFTIDPATTEAKEVLDVVSRSVFASMASVTRATTERTPASSLPTETQTFATSAQVMKPWHATTATLLPAPAGQSMSWDSGSDVDSDSSGSFQGEGYGVSASHAEKTDLERWGIDAVYNFGYRLDQVVGEFGTSDDPSMRRCMWRASRVTDGREVLLLCTTMDGELQFKTTQQLRKEFRALHKLRGEAVVGAEAMLLTRFDAWFVFRCTAGAAVRAYEDERQPSALPTAISLFVQLLQALAHINLSAPAVVAVEVARRILDAGTKALSGADAPASLDPAHATQPPAMVRRDAHVDHWAAPLCSYAEMWGGLPADAQEEGISLVIRSGVLLGVIARDKAPAALLSVFRQYIAMDPKVRPPAVEILRHAAGACK